MGSHSKLLVFNYEIPACTRGAAVGCARVEDANKLFIWAPNLKITDDVFKKVFFKFYFEFNNKNVKYIKIGIYFLKYLQICYTL